MALFIRDSRGAHYAPFGYMLAVPSGVVQPWGWYGDPVCNLFSGTFVKCGAANTATLIGCHAAGEDLLIRKFRTKPISSPYHDGLDWRLFGSRLSGIQGTLDALGGSQVLVSIPANETNVIHTDLGGDSGIAVPKGDFFLPAPDQNLWGTTVKRVKMPNGAVGTNSLSQGITALWARSVLGGITVDASRFESTSPYPVSSRFGERVEHLKAICNGVSPATRLSAPAPGWYTYTYSSGGNGLAHCNVLNLSVEGDYSSEYFTDPVYIKYTVVNSATGGSPYFPNQATYAMRWDVTLKFEYIPSVPEPTFHVGSTGNYYRVASQGRFVWSYTIDYVASWTTSPYKSIASIVTFRHGSYAYTATQACLANWPAMVDDCYWAGYVRKVPYRAMHELLSSFRRSAEEDLLNLLPVLPISTSAALTEASSNNNLENSFELQGVGEIIPDVKKALDVIRDILGKRIDLMTLVQLLDVLTSEYLRFSFGTRPTVDFLLMELPRLMKLGGPKGNSNLVGRGKHRFVMPSGTYGREELVLTARTKVVYKNPTWAIANFIYTGNLYGLTPLPSNWWDLYPMSFVVDWFTGVGARMTVAENVVYNTVYDIGYYVHSIGLESPLTKDELDAFHLTATHLPGSTPPELRHYRRFVSRHMPPFREGVYDFLQPHDPPWVTAAALAYQLFS